MLICLVLLVCLMSHDIHAFIAPDVVLEEYENCGELKVLAVKLTSTRTQLPYEYYSLPFCKPPGGVFYKTETFGEVLRGDRIVITPFQFRVNRSDSCKILCQGKTLSIKDQKLLYKRITEDYHVHLLADNLPVATPYVGLNGNDLYVNGYLLGMVTDGEVNLHNHLEFTVKYHHYENSFRIVGFEVHPKSLKNDELLEEESAIADKCATTTTPAVPALKNCKRSPGKGNSEFSFFKLEKDPKAPITVNYTYSLMWEPSELKWASRWDIYLSMSNAQIHWLSILNSLVVIFFLAGVLAATLGPTLKKDASKHSRFVDYAVRVCR